MCTQYQLHPPADIVFYITDVALPPLIFGLGIAGNLLLLLVLNLREMRRESAVYVYLAATAGVDVLALLCAVPPFLRDVELLPVPVAHSYPAAVAVWVRRAIDPMLRHSVAWFAALIVVLRFASVDLQADGSDAPQVPDSPSRWTRISSARIVAFVAVVGCSLLDFTRFFDATVVPLVGHCFDPDWLLWSVNRTRFAYVRPFYAEIQPAVSALAGGAVPLAVTALFGAILWLSTTVCCRRHCCRCRPGRSSPPVAGRRSACLRTPADHVERENQLTSTVIAITVAAVCLDGPRIALDVVEAFRLVDATGSDVIGSLVADRPVATTTLAYVVRYVGQVARCLSLLRCAINFVLIAVLDYDFRKTLRRAFCCCCPSADDVYYEPVTCCCCRRSSAKDVDPAETEATTKCDVIDSGHQVGNRKDWKVASSSISSSASSSRKRDNRTTAEHAVKLLPAVRDDGPSGIDGNAATDVGVYCDVDDDRALWV